MAEEYRYGMYNRPAGYGTAPDGWFNPQRAEDYIYETVAYPRKLTAQELYKWQMFPVSDNAYAFQVGERVVVNDCDPGMVIAHIKSGRYTVRFDSTGEEETVIAEELSSVDLHTPAGCAALTAPVSETHANDPIPYDETDPKIAGLDDYQFAQDWHDRHPEYKPGRIIGVVPDEPTRDELIAALGDVLRIAVNCCEEVQMKMSDLNTLATAQMLLARCK